MELFLLYLTAFLRPIFFIEAGSRNLFAVGAIALTAALGLAFLIRATIAKSLRFTAVDFLGVAFTLWCLSSYIVYFEDSSLRELARLIIPILTFTIAANIIRDENDYRLMLRLMLVGLSIPIFLSVAVIAMGGGVERPEAHYYTGALRWAGVYDGPHSLGHNAAFFFFVAAIYLSMYGRDVRYGAIRLERWFLSATALAAIFCIGMSQVRTVILGLGVYICVYLYFRSKKALLVSLGMGAVGFVLVYPFIKPYLFPELVMAERGLGDISYIGSGRFYIWAASLNEFARLPIDQKLAGFGIGRLVGVFGTELQSHNDYLDLLLRTGLVGCFLYLARDFLIFRAILAVSGGPSRHMLLSMFLAVLTMNLTSVSYIGRFGLGQMYSMVLTYIAVAAVQQIPAPSNVRPSRFPLRSS